MAYRKIEAVEHGSKKTVVAYNSALREYRCRLYENGEAHEPADYFTNDKADALGTAKLMVRPVESKPTLDEEARAAK